MALEGKTSTVAPQLFTSNGTAQGLITVADTAGFRTKQSAYLKSNTKPDLAVQVKRVLSPTLLVVGKIDNKIAAWQPLDVSAYITADSAAIGAEEQNKNNIPLEEHYRAIYESDPVVADRVVFVDKYGNFYDDKNPLPIIFDGTIAIGGVRTTANDNDPLAGDQHSSVRIGDGTTEAKVGSDGSLWVVDNSKMIKVPFDEQAISYDANQNITQILYKLAGNVVATQTLTYDANLNIINNKIT